MINAPPSLLMERPLLRWIDLSIEILLVCAVGVFAARLRHGRSLERSDRRDARCADRDSAGRSVVFCERDAAQAGIPPCWTVRVAGSFATRFRCQGRSSDSSRRTRSARAASFLATWLTLRAAPPLSYYAFGTRHDLWVVLLAATVFTAVIVVFRTPERMSAIADGSRNHRRRHRDARIRAGFDPHRSRLLDIPRRRRPTAGRSSITAISVST